MIFRKTIRTADEELGNVWYTIMLTLIWYGGLIKSILLRGYQTSLAMFLIVGLLPFAVAVRQVQRVRYYRTFHRQCIELGKKERGRVVNCIREYMWDDNAEGRKNRSKVARYYLIIEVQNEETGIYTRIQSQGYSFPIYRYLRDPWVEVYSDQSGWKKVLDGFHIKKSFREPDIPLENSNVYLKDFSIPSSLFKGISFILLIYMFIQIVIAV